VYNKRRAHLQAKLPDDVYTSRQHDILTDKRGQHITDYLHVASRHIGTLIIGKNDGWKQAITPGKRTNRNVVLASHARFTAMLSHKTELVGIQVVVSKERYASKCSFLDLEPMGKQEVYAGKRVKRGLFRASEGRCLNADINGAYNTLRKGVPDGLGNGIAGVVVHPVRMALMNWPHGSTVHVA
jgi:IS605 OrfB family transposase